MAFFLIFFILELAYPDTAAARIIAFFLALITAIRLYQWHDRDIWRHPLLWGLFVAFSTIALGFPLFSVSPLIGASKILVLHTFTIGGIGFATLSMMVRAAIGHYGGDIRTPPHRTSVALVAPVIAELFRIPLPLFFPSLYVPLVVVAQIAWMVAYGILTAILIGIFWARKG